MENFLQRLVYFTEKEGISITQIEREIGASKGVLSRALKNNTDIQSKWVTAIVDKYLQLSPDWLISGNGNMYREEFYPKYDFNTRERTKLFCLTNGIKELDFVKETGLTMTGIKKKYPNLNPVWLLTGTGDMFIHNIDGNYNIGSGNQAIGGSTININDTQVIQLQKRIEELEKLVEQKDKMIDILTGRK